MNETQIKHIKQGLDCIVGWQQGNCGGCPFSKENTEGKKDWCFSKAAEKAYELITHLEYELYNQRVYIESNYVKKEMYDIILERHKRAANDYISIKQENENIRREKESLIPEIIELIDNMIGGKMIAQALREIYLEEDL